MLSAVLIKGARIRDMARRSDRMIVGVATLRLSLCEDCDELHVGQVNRLSFPWG